MIDEVLGKLGFDWKVAIANVVNFLIIYYLLRNVVFKKIGNAIRERQAKITQGLEDAEKAHGALVEASARKDELMREAYQDSQQIIENAKTQRGEIIARASEEAEEEAHNIRNNAVHDAAVIMKKADEDIHKKAVEVVVSSVEKVLKDSMDEKINKEYVKTLLKSS